MRPFSWLKAGEGREHASSNPLCAPAASLPGTLGNPSAGGCHLAAVPSPALDYFTSSVSPSLLQTYFPTLHLLRGAQWILCPEDIALCRPGGSCSLRKLVQQRDLLHYPTLSPQGVLWLLYLAVRLSALSLCPSSQ